MLSYEFAIYLMISIESISEDERDLISKYYVYLNKTPNALAKIYISLPSYDFSSIINFYAYLDQLRPLNLSESLEILLP